MIEGEAESIDSSRIRVRLRIKDDYGNPAYNKNVYAAFFKEISDLLGIVDIPTNVKDAE